MIFFKSVNIWQSYKQKRDCLVHFLRLLAVCCNYAKYSPIIFFHYTLSNKPFLISLLTTPPHLTYVATLPCNLSLMVCFADINVSQGSVATYTRCGGMFTIRLTANLQRNLPRKKFPKSVKI